MGVEEEFLLVDAESRHTVARAEAVLSRAADALPPGANVHTELAPTQVEISTAVCTDLSGLRQQLAAGRLLLAASASAEDAVLVSSGTPVLTGADHPVTAGGRFEKIGDTYQGLVAGYQACGCHVHVGLPDRETAVAVLNHLRWWLPTLVALSVNSPFNRGRDTGYGSWRMIEQARFPGAGIPPYFSSADAYDEQVARLVDCGTVIDPAMTFWLARPSPRFPTVEVRAADAAGTVEDAVLQAALTRALVRTALADLAHGREAQPVGDQIAAAAVWSAARHGLDGVGVDLASQRRVSARELVSQLVERLTPALEDTGDLTLVRGQLSALLAGGTGARRQRIAARSGSLAVVDMLARRTVPVLFTAARDGPVQGVSSAV
jgi:glutamate---cysteine ligase / carboxylate-amine ligase